MTYADAMRDYGSDKPDLRVPLKLTELTDVMKTAEFKVFRAAADLPNGRVAALSVPGGGTLTRKEIDDYTAFVKIYGAGGLAYIKVNDAAKAERGRAAVADRQVPVRGRAEDDPRAHRRADRATSFSSAPTAKRSSTTRWARCAPRSATSAGFATQGWKPLWVVDFPMFEYNDEAKTWAARHHPFTAPKDGHEDMFESDPGKVLAKAYDVVLNGWEIGGGSVRIHRPDVQAKVFASLKISAEDQRRSSASCSTRCQYGAPPHGGIAFGFDRMVAMMAGVDAIRDVIAFPKTQRGQDLLIDTPTPVTEQQLRDLHIKVRPSDAIKAT